MKLNSNLSELNRGVYLDLCSLFDLRLSAVLELLPDKILKQVDFDSIYKNRISDNIITLNKNLLYRYIDANRDRLIKTSMVTSILDHVFLDIEFLRTTGFMIDEHKLIPIYLNTYGYNISENMITTLKKYILTRVPVSGITVEILDVDPYSIKTDKMSEMFYSVYMYRGYDWLQYKLLTRELIKQTIPDLRFNIPGLLHMYSPSLSAKEYDKFIDELIEGTATFINLNLLPVAKFSIRKKDEDKIYDN